MDGLRPWLLRATGTLNLGVLVVALVWLGQGWYPLDEVPRLPSVAQSLALACALALVGLWVLPWGRLPAFMVLPLVLLGLSGTTVLILAGQRPSTYLLLFLWVAFAAICAPPRLGLAIVGLIAALRLALADSIGPRGERVDVLLVTIPGYLILYALARIALDTFATLLRDTRVAQRDATRLAALYDFSALLGGENNLNRLLTALMQGLGATFGYRFVSVFLLTGDRLRLMAQVGYQTPITDLALGEGITGTVAREGRPLLVRDGRRHPNYLFAEEHFGSQASVPLIHRGRVVGVLNLEGAVDELKEDDLRLLETLAGPTATAIANADLLARLDSLAHRDPLTDLLNRRGVIAALEAALTAITPGEATVPVTVLLVDLNGFKAVNDRYGHAIGDALLVELAGLLASSVRADDIVGRLGGDEFLVVMPGADQWTASAVVERLTATIAAYSFPLLTTTDGLPPPVGYSLGTATAPEDGTDAEALLYVADHAMYHAKRGATSQIRFIGPSGVRQSAD